MVIPVRHTYLNGTMALDIYDIADLVNLHVSSKRNGTMFFEGTREQISRTSAITLWISHFLIGSTNEKPKKIRIKILKQKVTK